jgi:hypothetical protein
MSSKFAVLHYRDSSSAGGGQCLSGYFKGLDLHWSPEED